MYRLQMRLVRLRNTKVRMRHTNLKQNNKSLLCNIIFLDVMALLWQNQWILQQGTVSCLLSTFQYMPRFCYAKQQLLSFCFDLFIIMESFFWVLHQMSFYSHLIRFAVICSHLLHLQINRLRCQHLIACLQGMPLSSCRLETQLI